MNLLNNETLLPKKHDYQAILAALKQIYGKDQRRYSDIEFKHVAFAKIIAQKYPERYGNQQQTQQYFMNFWHEIYQWLNTVGENNDIVNVAEVRQTIVMFMKYDFDPASNVEYF